MPVLLQVNFTRSPAHAHAATTESEKLEAARRTASQPGLSWKISVQEEGSETRGGIYLFEDLASAKAYAEGQVAPRLHERGATDISIRYFNVNEEASRLTRAPLDAPHAVAA